MSTAFLFAVVTAAALGTATMIGALRRPWLVAALATVLMALAAALVTYARVRRGDPGFAFAMAFLVNLLQGGLLNGLAVLIGARCAASGRGPR